MKYATPMDAAAYLGIDPPHQIFVLLSWDPPGARTNNGLDIEVVRNYLLDHPERLHTRAPQTPPKSALPPPSDEDSLEFEEQELKNEKLRKAIRQMDLAYEREIGELVPRQQIREAIAAAAAPICVALEKHLDRPTYNKVCTQIRDAFEDLEKKLTAPVKRSDATRNRK